MKFKVIKAVLAMAVAVAFVSPVQAQIVDSGNYLTDNATNLQWLDVTETVGLSFSQVSGLLASNHTYAGQTGWRYATADEFVGLVTDYTGNSTPTTGPASSYLAFIHGEAGGLISMLGNTLDLTYLAYYGKTYSEYTGRPEGSYTSTTGILDTSFTARITNNGGSDVAQIYNVSYQITDPGIGSYLVRSVSAVPEPETYAMMLVGLGVLGATARRRKANQA